MLFCPTCITFKPGKSSSEPCEFCGGNLIVQKDSSRFSHRDSDEPKELQLGFSEVEFKRKEKPKAQPWSRINAGQSERRSPHHNKQEKTPVESGVDYADTSDYEETE